MCNVGEGYNIQLESIGYIQRVRKFLGLEKFWIIGHSMGAGLGSLYTATFPEHVRVSGILIYLTAMAWDIRVA